jgi:hypothetical protein
MATSSMYPRAAKPASACRIVEDRKSAGKMKRAGGKAWRALRRRLTP